MNFVQCRRLLAVLLYCGAVELVIVDGQSTTDDNIDTDDNVELRDRVAKLESYLAAAVEGNPSTGSTENQMTDFIILISLFLHSLNFDHFDTGVHSLKIVKVFFHTRCYASTV